MVRVLQVQQRYRAVRDEVVTLTPEALLEETVLWLKIAASDARSGWTLRVLDDQRFSLQELREILSDPHSGARARNEARERLRGYCIRLRLRHDGASATDVLSRAGRR